MRIHHVGLLLIALGLSACNSLASEEARTWTVGSDLANPPFAWVDEAGVERGRDVEMAQALARELGVELVWQRMSFDELLDALEQGEVDAVIATLGETPERAKRVLLSEPYFRTSLRVLVRRGDGEPTSLADLTGRSVAAGIGTTSEAALRDKLPEARAALPSAKGSSSIERLAAGEVDALIMDGPDAFDYVHESPEQFALLEPALATENYVVAIRPGAEDQRARVNLALRKLTATGVLDDLDRKFGLLVDLH